MAQAHPRLLVGLDAGGSKTAVVARYGQRLLRREGPGTNLTRDGVPSAARRLEQLITETADGVPSRTRLVVVGGVAGAGRASERQALAQRLRESLSLHWKSVLVELMPDSELTLESAFPYGQPGIVCIAGTGSIVLGRTLQGTLVRVGGWGARVDGDPGSGHALGHAFLATAADHLDSERRTAVLSVLAERCNVLGREDLIRLAHDSGFIPASLAPLVLELASSGEAVTRQIVKDQVTALCSRLKLLATRPIMSGAGDTVVVAGGLMDDEYFRQGFADALRDELPVVEVRRATSAPEAAALELAQRIGAGIRR